VVTGFAINKEGDFMMTDRIVRAEIEYMKEDRTWVHSDIEPHGGCKFNDLDDKHRKFLHDCLDEWIDKSNGTGCFYIRDEDFKNMME
jgi:hypothetical protein